MALDAPSEPARARAASPRLGAASPRSTTSSKLSDRARKAVNAHLRRFQGSLDAQWSNSSLGNGSAAPPYSGDIAIIEDFAVDYFAWLDTAFLPNLSPLLGAAVKI